MVELYFEVSVMVSLVNYGRLVCWLQRRGVLSTACEPLFDERRLLVDYIDDRNENGFIGCGGGDGELYAEFARGYLVRLGGLAAVW